jgi:hypothetical protein
MPTWRAFDRFRVKVTPSTEKLGIAGSVGIVTALIRAENGAVNSCLVELDDPTRKMSLPCSILERRT